MFIFFFFLVGLGSWFVFFRSDCLRFRQRVWEVKSGTQSTYMLLRNLLPKRKHAHHLPGRGKRCLVFSNENTARKRRQSKLEPRRDQRLPRHRHVLCPHVCAAPAEAGLWRRLRLWTPVFTNSVCWPWVLFVYVFFGGIFLVTLLQ